MNIFNNLLIAVALSMDAFSLSVSLEANKLLTANRKKLLTLLVGIFHFLMPLIGSRLGLLIRLDLGTFSRYILAGIFIILSIEIITDKNQIHKKINLLSLIIISITVSLDSMTIGIGLSLTKEYTIFSSIIFSITSMLFTFTGLIFGDCLNKYTKNKTNLVGGLILIVLALKYLFNI